MSIIIAHPSHELILLGIARLAEAVDQLPPGAVCNWVSAGRGCPPEIHLNPSDFRKMFAGEDASWDGLFLRIERQGVIYACLDTSIKQPKQEPQKYCVPFAS